MEMYLAGVSVRRVEDIKGHTGVAQRGQRTESATL